MSNLTYITVVLVLGLSAIHSSHAAALETKITQVNIFGSYNTNTSLTELAEVKAQGAAVRRRRPLFTKNVQTLLSSPEEEVEKPPPALPQCTLPGIPKKRDLGTLIPPLPAGKRPNIIVVLVDDLGWDDIAMHHPDVEADGHSRYLSTPNLDKLMRMSKEFRNFYVTPMCSQSRAELLTGRDYARTGTLLVNGGYDYIHRQELNIAQAMKRLGYKTSHFGKWHNGRTLGYEPWNQGFEESWMPQPHLHLDNLFRHNGDYVQTKGLMEERLMDRLLNYLEAQKGSSSPFFMYYASHVPHAGVMRVGEGPRWLRPAPAKYNAKYQRFAGLSDGNAEFFGSLEYFDSVFGRLLDYLINSDLLDSTYIFLTGDNGSELFASEEIMPHREVRMPSKMVGNKKDTTEGGNRLFLLVAGPGVPAGATDYTLTSIKDVMSTAISLAGGTPETFQPWQPDGLSMQNLLAPKAAPNAAQEGRMLFQLKPDCFWPDMVLPIGPDRRTLRRGQPMLDYNIGGKDGTGWQQCISVRWGLYKWNGDRPNKLYRLIDNNHIEQECNRFTAPSTARLISEAKAAAERWWRSLVAERFSFQKPTFLLKFRGYTETNIIVDGAFDRTPGRVVLQPTGATGFSKVGDYVAFRVLVLEGGYYRATILYTSTQACTMRLSIGSYSSILEGKAPTITFKLPKQEKAAFISVGGMTLPRTAVGNDEIRLEVISMQTPGAAIFTNLEVLRLSWRQRAAPTALRVPIEALSLAFGDASAGSDVNNVWQTLPTGLFKSPLMRQQQYNTPSWVKSPGFYDPCGAEGVLYDAETCGLTEADFAG